MSFVIEEELGHLWVIHPFSSLQLIRAASSRVFVNMLARLMFFVSLLAPLYYSIDDFKCTRGGIVCCKSAPQNCGDYALCASCCSGNITGVCSASLPPFCICCAETNAYCCRGSYKECEAVPQLPNCHACCVPHAAETCTQYHPHICRCGVQK